MLVYHRPRWGQQAHYVAVVVENDARLAAEEEPVRAGHQGPREGIRSRPPFTIIEAQASKIEGCTPLVDQLDVLVVGVRLTVAVPVTAWPRQELAQV